MSSEIAIQSGAATPPQFPIHRLPSKLLHHICAHLTPAEIANARLYCGNRIVATTGLEYLVPEGHAFIQEASIQQLESIASNLVFHKHVKSLFFEIDTLPEITFAIWITQVSNCGTVSLHADT